MRGERGNPATEGASGQRSHVYVHQPNAWTCGPASLRNAIAAHGRRVDVRRVVRLSGIAKDTFDTLPGLQSAAKELGFSMRPTVLHEPTGVLEALWEEGAALACVDQNSHWVAVVGASRRWVTVCDPARGAPVVQRWTWRALCRRLAWGLADEQRFHVYPVRPIDDALLL